MTSKEIIHYAGGAELVPAATPSGGGDDLDLRGLWGALWRRKLLLAGTVTLITGAAIVFVQTATPLYRAETLIRIQPGQPLLVDLPDVTERFEADNPTIESEIELLRSRAFAERMVERLQLVDDPEFNTALDSGEPGAVAASPTLSLRVADRFAKAMSVEQVGKSYVIGIRVTSEQPAKSAAFANAVGDAYIKGQLAEKLRATERAKGWLQQRVQEMRRRVVAAEGQIVGLQSEKGIVSVGRVDPLAQQIGQLSAQLAEARAGRAEAEARYRQIVGIVRSPAGMGAAAKVMNSPLMNDLRGLEMDVQRQLAELSIQYGERHPQMLNAQAQLGGVRARIIDEAQRVVQDLSSELAVSRAREAELASSLAAVQSQIAGQEVSSVELRDGEREAASSRQIYETFLNRLREVTEAHDLQRPDASMLSPAQIPLDPAYPYKSLIVLIAFGAAGVLGVILVFAVEQWGAGFGLRSADEVAAAMGVRALALIPALGRRELQAGSAEDYVLRRPQSAFSEAVQRIRTSLFLGGGSRPTRTVLVTSSLPGEGKSLLCAALARQSARSGLKTLLIDADMRRPRLHEAMGCGNHGGLGDLLGGVLSLDAALRTDEASGLRFLPAGTPPSSPPDLIRSPAMRRLLDEVSASFDLVIIDSPPVGAVSDAFILAGMADRTLFVARWAKTPRNMVTGVVRQLVEAGAVLAGVVLSRVDIKKHASYQYADSGYYSGEYRKYYVN